MEETVASQKGSHTASNELDVDPELIKMYLRPSTIFPTFPFNDVMPMKCHFFPQNIDGNKCYRVKCTVKNYSKIGIGSI